MSRIAVVERAFACAACNAQAGVVQLFGPVDRAEVVRQSFTSRLTFPVEAETFETVRAMILAGDIGRLHAFDQEVACFYCPLCLACYCGDHWAHWDVFEEEDGFSWHDSIRGRCPRGHVRMLED